MKKILESELMSIAHSILKLKGKEDIDKMYLETQKLYEKLSILRFYEKNKTIVEKDYPIDKLEKDLLEKNDNIINTNENNTPPEVLFTPTFELKESENIVIDTPLEIKEEIVNKQELENLSNNNFKVEETIIDELIENNEIETENKLDENPIELSEKEDLLKTENIINNKYTKIEEYLFEKFEEPEFVVKNKTEEPENLTELVENDQPKEKNYTENSENKNTKEDLDLIKKIVEDAQNKVNAIKSERNLSINESISKGINIGLNDRIGFVKHLFNGSNEDFNRVISQLATIETFKEAHQFINIQIKPDYNKWEGKEEYELRFLNLIEKKYL